jgi:hypothetical protein
LAIAKKWTSAMFQVLNVGVACPELLLNIEKLAKFIGNKKQNQSKYYDT